jgi:hypothetical protein
LEFGLQMPAPWVTGWLRLGQVTAALPAILDCGDPTLIVIDDADTRADVPGDAWAVSGAGSGRSSPRAVLIGSGIQRLCHRLGDCGRPQRAADGLPRDRSRHGSSLVQPLTVAVQSSARSA